MYTSRSPRSIRLVYKQKCFILTIGWVHYNLFIMKYQPHSHQPGTVQHSDCDPLHLDVNRKRMLSINNPLKFAQSLQKSLCTPLLHILAVRSIHSRCSLVSPPSSAISGGGYCGDIAPVQVLVYQESDISGSPGRPDLTLDNVLIQGRFTLPRLLLHLPDLFHGV